MWKNSFMFWIIVTLMVHQNGCSKINRTSLLSVCHGKYGCFSVDYPWFSSHRVVNAFPRSDKEIHPNFLLYTRANPKTPHPLYDDEEASVLTSDFDAKRMTFVITHGYLEHGKKDWLVRMKDELLIHGNHNVIVLSWLGGSRPPYTQATANTRMVGAMTAHLLKFLHDLTGMDLFRTHMIGHSLGAHLAGYTGEAMKRFFGMELGRITGLDPADPHFEETDPIIRLDETDAYYVDAIHTDANPLLSGGLGIWQPVGHLDFYPNGGRQQAGCKKGFIDNVVLEKGNFAFALRRTFGCNHIRAYEYFIESINSNCKFVAVECPNYEAFASAKCGGCDGKHCDFMGLSAFSNLNGAPPPYKNRALYLMTAEDDPFCAVHYRVTIVLSDTKISKKQGGDRGNFYMILNGDSVSSVKLRLNPEEAFFEPGRVYHFIAITGDLGHVHSADLIWEYSANPINPLTWRIHSPSLIYVNRVEIEQFGHAKKHTFCADDKPFESGKPQNVIWKPKCRDNRPDPGNSLLGALLNADPAGNAKFVFDQVNPLNTNPLNGLEAITDTFSGFAKTVNTVRNVMRNKNDDAKTPR